MRIILFLLLAASLPAAEHPYMLWTRPEAAAIRQRIETDDWAKARYEKLLKETGRGETFRNLFRYVVMGDAKAGEVEKNYLLKIIGTHPRNFEKMEHGGRHYDCYLDALRYDCVYDLLTPEERTKIEATFRDYVAYQLTDTKEYTRTSWLPNMQWPRVMSAHLMAVALGDEKLIRQLINSNGGWKYYFDEYIADGQFYNEEFGKHYSMIGEMLLFCRGLERLGLNDLGYGYTGKHGATMRRYVESIINVGYPRVEIPGFPSHYPKITMGDARGANIEGAPPYVFQHSIVPGFKNPPALWFGANMNGRDHQNTKIDKIFTPQWFEIAHTKWPEAGFDYFLQQMGEPTLYWGVAPTKNVKPPAAPSYVAPERGFAFLRAEESPGYWESPAPAVALQFATYYVHYTHDCFSLLGYYAFNRPIYLNRSIAPGYAGGDPWTDSLRGHSGVVVDNLQPNPTGNVTIRSDFKSAFKYVSVRGDSIYNGVTMERSLLLTRDYLLDVFEIRADKPHTYHWQVHALGNAAPPGWQPTDELHGKLYPKSVEDRYELHDVHKLDTAGKPWSVTVTQIRATPTGVLPEAWYDRKVGVRVRLLGAPGTTAYAGKTAEGPGALTNEVGGTTVIAARTTTNTTFIALHEPFEHGLLPAREFRLVSQTEDTLEVAVGDDCIMFSKDKLPVMK